MGEYVAASLHVGPTTIAVVGPFCCGHRLVGGAVLARAARLLAAQRESRWARARPEPTSGPIGPSACLLN